MTARQLDLELNPLPLVVHASPSNPVVVVALATDPPKTTANPLTRPAPAELVASKTEPASPMRGTPPPGRSPPPADPAIRPEVVQVAEAPVVRATGESAPAPPIPASPSDDETLLNTTSGEKKGFFQRLNPANLFRRDSKPAPVITPLPGSVPAQPDPTREFALAANSDSTARTPAVSRQRAPTPLRYAYRSPPRPAPGNRTEAQARFAAGYEAQRDHRVDDAVTAYRAATQADPGFFEAQSNLGLAAYDAGNLPLALSAYETALAITPDSFNARYNFALALRKANYVIDAAEEAERLLVVNSSETPPHLAAVHLMLGSFVIGAIPPAPGGASPLSEGPRPRSAEFQRHRHPLLASRQSVKSGGDGALRWPRRFQPQRNENLNPHASFPGLPAGGARGVVLLALVQPHWPGICLQYPVALDQCPESVHV